jgi:plastocyanin
MRKDPLLLSLAVLAGLALSVLPALAADQTVTVSSNEFTPVNVTIEQGDTVTWSNSGGSHNVRFDDGSFEQPPSPDSSGWTRERTFATAGTFSYYCEQHIGSGMTGTVTVNPSGTGTTTGPPPTPPAADTTRPAIARLSLSRKRFRVAPARARQGTSFRFRLSEIADVRIAIARVIKGRKRTRYRVVGVIARADRPSGANTIRFNGRFGRTRLAVGRFRATITATDAAGNASLARRVSFRILRRG